MTKSLLAYLLEPIEPWDGRGPFDFLTPPTWLPEKPTRLCLLAALIAMNGGRMTVYSWGVSDGGGPYGKSGLSQQEALALIRLGHFIDGWLAADELQGVGLGLAIRAEHDRVIALHEAAQGQASP
jgi:hypothetical protein